MKHYCLLEHTADLGFRCEGKTRERLFEACALALCDIIASTEALATTESRAVRATGSDDPQRLRAFLDEVLFLFEKEAFLVKECDVTFEGDAVKGELRGVRLDLDRDPVERVVKAVTYHGLEVKKTRTGFRAQVILDL